MKKNNKSIFLPQEEEEIKNFTKQLEEDMINIDEFCDRCHPFLQNIADRELRIAENKMTKEDIKNGFTPKNFPHLTVFSKEYYPEKYWKKLQKLNKK